MSNRLILMQCDEKTGLLCFPTCEYTNEPLALIAAPVLRGRNLVGRIVTAKEVNGKMSARVWDYLSEAETRQCKLFHDIRINKQNTLLQHHASNLASYIRTRSVGVMGIRMMHQVQDGWWLRNSDTPVWNEIGALMRLAETQMKRIENAQATHAG